MADLDAWAASGAMCLTGRPDGPPMVAPGDPAGAVLRALARVAAATRWRTGAFPSPPDVRLLGERAAIAGLRRNGPWSCGGAFRLLPTSDGWWGVSLPRPADIELVPALIEEADPGDPWGAVARWARGTASADAVARGRLLGLPCCDPTSIDRSRPGVVTRQGGRRVPRERPRVIDLTSLWAGPLCAHLLGLGGAEVIKVESRHRPDGSRRGPRAFLDLLHGGHAMVAVDFHDPDAVARLHDLVASADLVLEASRPRALARLGLDADALVDNGVSWLSITARGRDCDAVGFGDDVAAGAGLVIEDGGELLPCGDALADPLTGVAAAAAAAEALLSERAALIDVSMHHVCAECSGPPVPHEVVRRADRWWVAWDGGEAMVADPVPRMPLLPAGELGADNERVLAGPR